MRVCDFVSCPDFPCADIDQKGYSVPSINIDPEAVSIVLISESAPLSPRDGYYAGGESLFEKTTVQAFNDAGFAVSSIKDILKLGVYLSTAVKCAKTAYLMSKGTIKACSILLEKEIALFPRAKALLLMGDAAIGAVNEIARRSGEPRVVPSGSTYKIRGGEFRFRGMRAFPSYLQAGPSFFIEKSKRKMIAEDIAAALRERSSK